MILIAATNIWRDLVDVAIRDDVPLQRKLIDLLERDDIYEAAFWAKKLKIKPIPTTVSKILDNIENGVDSFPPDEDNSNNVDTHNSISNSFNTANDTSFGGNDWSKSPWPESNASVRKSEYYEFPLPYSDIIYIDDRIGLDKFLEYLRTCTEVIYK